MLEKLAIDWSVVGPWLVVVFVQILWCTAGWAGQKFVTGQLRKWAEKTEGTFDDAIVAALPAPLNILVLVTGLMVAIRFAPLTDAKIVRFNGVVEILLMLAFVYFADRLMQAVLDSFEKKHEALKPLHFIISALMHVLVWGLGVMTVLSNLGISITPLLASLGVGSLAVALALQNTLANLFSGFYLLLDRPVRVGDLIKLESGEEGTVEVVGWRTAQIKTFGNGLIVIPNSKLAEAKLLNYDRPNKELAFFVEVGVAYHSDLDQVERVTVETAKEVLAGVQGGAKNFEPTVRFKNFGPSSIDFNVNLRAEKFTDQFLVKHEFIKALKKRYEKEGIEIPYPTQTLTVISQETGSHKENA
jgi:small-conductance mechanosensitive channel